MITRITRFASPLSNILLPHDGYHKLVTCRPGNLIYDAAAAFSANNLSTKDRTYRQFARLAKNFEEHGVFTERLYRIRNAQPDATNVTSYASHKSHESHPSPKNLKIKQDPTAFSGAAGSCFAFIIPVPEVENER